MNSFGNFFYRFWKNIKTIFSGWNLMWQAFAMLLTWIIVASDFDWKYYTASRSIPPFFLFPAMIAGGLLPMVLPFLLWGIGIAKKNIKVLASAFALGQAALLGWLVSAFYKAFTGRMPPEFGHGLTALDISRKFQFGFWRGGIFWGWPSSHTTVAFAMALALVILFPKNRVVKILAILYALYIGLAVSVSIHWFSEFLAGAIFGSIIGIAVGKSFYQRFAKN